MLGIALILYMLVRPFARTTAGGLAFASTSGITVLTAVPVCWLYIVHATWNTYDGGTFWGTYGYVSVLELAVAGGLLCLVRNQAIWLGSFVFVLHYTFWVLVMGKRSFMPVLASGPLSLVFLCAGIAWLRYIRPPRPHESPRTHVPVKSW